MSNLIQVQSGSKSFGARTLFTGAQFSVNEGEHIGVIGPNGAGKTTMFKILTEELSLDSGTITRSKSLRLGYLAQHDQWTPTQTVEDFLLSGCVTPLWELKSLGRGLGIAEDMYDKPISSLSGGYRMRCKLLYLIGQEPNLMLLDEPTNYLDLETTLVLEDFLQGYKGAFLLISHDREFLRRTTDHILEIELGDVTKYNGNIDDYFEQKELLRGQLEARATTLKNKREEILEFVARFGAKATKAKQAQSRLKSLDKMETIELKALPVSAAIKIPPPMRTGKVILTMNNSDLGYGEKVILKDVTYSLQNGEHVAIVGLNGAGKSTLLKSLAGSLAPVRGNVELGLNVTIGYYAQHVAENLNSSKSVLQEIMAKAHPDVLPQDGLNMAGSLLFSGEDVNKKIAVLSGGEKSRVALGQILLQKAPCLILDEPTNHLDFQTVEALTQALSKFEGTVVVVSHDRSFIRRIGKKIIEINHGQVTVYPGTYDDYVWSLQKGALSRPPRPAPSQNENADQSLLKRDFVTEKINFKDAKKNLDRQIKSAEKKLLDLISRIEKLNSRLHEINNTISTSSGVPPAALIEELGVVQQEIDSKEAEWLEVSEQKDSCERQMRELTGN